MALPTISQQNVNNILSEWKSLQIYNQLRMEGFVSPTFFLAKGAKLPRINYYKTKDIAYQQLLFNTKTPGAKDQKSAGSVSFKADGTAQTAGINIELYLPVPFLRDYAIPYELFKLIQQKISYPYYLVRFYKTNGTGPYFTYLTTQYYGVSATVVKASGEQLAVMKAFYSDLDLIKSRYNSLVNLLNVLSDMPFEANRQETINRLTQKRIDSISAIQQIKGLQFITGKNGELAGIGIAMIPLIIILSVVGAAAWGLNTWITERQKTQRIADGLAHEKWGIEEQEKIARDPNIPPEIKTVLIKNIDKAIETGKKVAEDASKGSKTMFGEVGDIVKWAAIGLGVFAIANMVGKIASNNNNNNSSK